MLTQALPEFGLNNHALGQTTDTLRHGGIWANWLNVLPYKAPLEGETLVKNLNGKGELSWIEKRKDFC